MEAFFSKIDNLEPKCPGCGTVIDYDVTTRYDEELESHVCRKCGKKV